METRAMSKHELKGLKKAAETFHQEDPAYKKDSNRQFFLYLVMVLSLALAIRLFIMEPVRVDGDSMVPTLMDGERMFVEKYSLWYSEPKRGEIVICFYPNYTVSCVKRVIGLPGDTISIKEGIVYINGVELDESAYWADRGGIDLDVLETVVPANSVYVIGDNRNASKDSRAWGVGSIPYERVIGRVHSVIWPLNARRSV